MLLTHNPIPAAPSAHPPGQPHHTLYSYIHTNFNKETYLLTPSPQGDLCVAKMVPPPGSRGPGAPGQSDPGHAADPKDRSVRCEASRNLKWSITNTGINAPVYKLTLPNPDAPGHEQPLFQISKPNPNAPYWTMFYFTYAGHLIPPKRIEFGKIQKNAAQGSGGGGGTRVTITGKSAEEKAVWQTLGEGNEDMVEWIVLCAALNVLDEEIIKAAEKSGSSITPSASAGSMGARSMANGAGSSGSSGSLAGAASSPRRPGANAVPSSRPSASSPPHGPQHMVGPNGAPMRGASPRPPAQVGPGPSRPGVAPYPQQSQQQPGAGPYQAPPARSYSGPRPGAGPADPRGYPQQQQAGGYPGGPGGAPGAGYARPPPPGAYGRPPPQQGGYPQQGGAGGGYPPQGYPAQQQQAVRRF